MGTNVAKTENVHEIIQNTERRHIEKIMHIYYVQYYYRQKTHLVNIMEFSYKFEFIKSKM